MNILYGIQGTGNGHISRARTLLPLLESLADVDVLVSGSSSEILPERPVTYQVHGLGYTFGRNGGIDLVDTARNFRPLRLIRDIQSLPAEKYDLVISDFEPVSARAARRAGKTCIGLSHQAAFLSPACPRPQWRSLAGEQIFRHYAPCTHAIGFHYQSYDKHIFTPIISNKIRELQSGEITVKPKDGRMHASDGAQTARAHGSGAPQHVTVYLPSIDDLRLMRLLEQITGVEWQIFSKRAKSAIRRGSVSVTPVDTAAFVRSLSGCVGLVCGAGFETPSEALFLGIPILAVPMKWQYEQQCNAAALWQLGVKVSHSVDNRFVETVYRWLENPRRVHIPYPDETELVIARILNLYEMSRAGTRFVL